MWASALRWKRPNVGSVDLVRTRKPPGRMPAATMCGQPRDAPKAVSALIQRRPDRLKPSPDNWVLPFESAKARKVGVGRVQHGIVLDRERREMGVGNQVAHRIPAAQHLLKNGPVLVGWLEDAHPRLVEPALHTLGGLLERERALVQSRIAADANESVQHRPAGSQPPRWASHQVRAASWCSDKLSSA